MPKRVRQAKQAKQAKVEAPPPTETAAWPALTLETILYAALLLGAAAIRFFDLGRWPLLTEEATQALASWRFLQGQPVGGGVVPLLFGGSLLGFFTLGAGDAVARLLPALLGTALVLLPMALRRRLGSWGALAATFALAFSPTLVFYSRTLAGPVPALAGLGAVLLAVELAEREQMQWAKAAATGGLAVAVTASPYVYTFMLAALAFLGLGWAANRRGAPWPGWALGEKRLRALAGDRRAWLGLAVAVLPLSTALFMNLGGLQGMANLLGGWLGGLLPGSGGRWWGYPLTLLSFYELGVLLLGLVGLGIGIARRNLWAGFLGAWALLQLVLAMLAGGRDAAATAFAVVPLALLSGITVAEIVSRLRPVQWAAVGIYVAVISVGLGFWWLFLTKAVNPVLAGTMKVYSPAFINRPGLTFTGADVVAVVAPIFVLAMILVLWFLFGRNETVWAVSIVGLGVLATLLLRNSVSLNLTYARDAREPMVTAPSSPALRDMVAFLEDWSVRKSLDQHTLPIAVEDDLEPLIPWYLRDFVDLRERPSPALDSRAAAVVMASIPGGQVPGGFARTQYRLRATSDAPLGSGKRTLAWWLIREGGGQVQAETIDLLVKP